MVPETVKASASRSILHHTPNSFPSTERGGGKHEKLTTFGEPPNQDFGLSAGRAEPGEFGFMRAKC